MSITIEVSVQCQATTYKGKQCTKEATLFEQTPSLEEPVKLVTAFTEKTKYDSRVTGGQYTKRDKVLGMESWSHAFHCHTHSRLARNTRARQSAIYTSHRVLTNS